MPRKGFPRLAMTAEIASILGLSSSRARAIATSDPRFPDPVDKVSSGDIYLWDEVVAYAAIERKPGRPASPK